MAKNLVFPGVSVEWSVTAGSEFENAHAQIGRTIVSADEDSPYESVQVLARAMQLIRQDYVNDSKISYKDLTFSVRPTGFKHTGLFPEQAVNWDKMRSLLAARPGAKVLNLFGYTGGATVACAKAGALVTHVDAAKGMVLWAKKNRGDFILRIEDTDQERIVEGAVELIYRTLEETGLIWD